MEIFINASIIILTYNNVGLVQKLVNQVIKMEIFGYIVIVDNHSLDDTYKQLVELFGDVDNVVVLETAKNGGYAFGNNVGLDWVVKNTNCDVCFFANPDVVFDKNCVKEIYLKLKKGHFSVLSPIMKNIDGNEEILNYWDEPTYKSEMLGCFYLYRKLMGNRKRKVIEYTLEIMEVFAVGGAFFAVRIKDFLEVDKFDESTFLFCEENIIGKKMKKANKKIGLLTELSYIHDHSSIIDDNFAFLGKYKMQLNSHFYFVKKYMNVNKLQLKILGVMQQYSIIEMGIILKFKKFFIG